MSREKKAQMIDDLEGVISGSSIGVLTDYRGLSHAEMTELRRRIQATGGEFRVVKNTLARFAAGKADREDLAEAFTGPVALATGTGDITEIARIVSDYIRETRLNLEIKSGFTSDSVLSPAEVTRLATLPSRDVLLAQLMGQINAPISSLVNVLSSPLRGLAIVLKAQIKQLEEA